MRFFVGLHDPHMACHFARCCISVLRLRRGPRRSDFAVHDWLLDSGAFSQIAKHGGYDGPASRYATEIRRWRRCGQLLAAVAEDYMCEPAMLQKTGLTIADHQRLTIERYDALQPLVDWPYILPVLQGYAPGEYLQHLAQYGDRLATGAWVGVGSVCKRNGTPREVLAVLGAIKDVRPDLQLHGFGLKQTALASREVRGLLASADSMAWSFNARHNGRNPNDWQEAARYVAEIEKEGR